MKKSFWGVILCLVLALCLTACKTPKGEEERFKLPDLGDAPFAIATAGAKTEYQLVYEDGLSDAQVARVEAAVATINATYSGIELNAVKDSESTVVDTEIVLGETSRSESKEIYSEITGIDQAFIKLGENGRVTFAASTPEIAVELLEAFVKKYVQDDKDGIFNIPAMMDFAVGQPAAEGWLLEGILSYPGGTYSYKTYDIGPGRNMDPDESAGQMQLVYGTTANEFKAYIDQMAANGFTVATHEDGNGNISAQFYDATREKSLVYAYYTALCGEARIIDDTASTFVKAFEYTCADGPIAIYQYAAMYNRTGNGSEKGDPYFNNGMTYVIRLADNKLIVVDGGNYRQATARATREFVQFMQEITQDEDGMVDIAAYFVSHMHSDHYSFMQRILETETLAGQVNIERLMWNTTNLSNDKYFGGLFEKRFPDAQFLKVHTGQQFKLGNITCEVMYTHEDFVDAETAKSYIVDFNNTSSVLKWTANGRSFLQFGDWGGQWYESEDYVYAEERMFALHTNSATGYNALKTDIVQVPHHAFNPYMETINKTAAGEYAFVPTADVTFSQLSHKGGVDTVCEQFIEGGTDPDKIYFASRYTYCLHVDQQGVITVAAENIRGADKGDDSGTSYKEQDYVNVTIKASDPYRVPTDEEFANWDLIH